MGESPSEHTPLHSDMIRTRDAKLQEKANSTFERAIRPDIIDLAQGKTSDH